jgi:tryptophan synthase alpha chain
MKGIYIMGGYPDSEAFLDSAKAVSDAGFDFIEIGIPFNDPVADGPVIAAAGLEALKTGVTTESILNDMKKLSGLPLKKYIMTYANIISAYGRKNFSEDFGSLIDGLIIADLPNRMRSIFSETELSIPVIPFATLETRDSDLDILCKADGDFIYFVALRGITGSRSNLDDPLIRQKIEMIKKRTDKPVIVGFGIKDSSDIAKALTVGNGYVIGTEAVARQKDPESFRRYLYSLKA